MAKRPGDDVGAPEWGLFVNEQRRDLSARKSIKLKLPIRQHIKLHALKLFSENNISQTVEAALDLYFEKMRQEELAARLAAQDPLALAGEGPEGAGAGAAAPSGGLVVGGEDTSGAPQGPRGPGA